MTSALQTGAGVAKTPGGGLAVTALHRPPPGQRRKHQVRVFPGFHDATSNLRLRCCCGEARNLEPGHTAAELNILALQHRRGQIMTAVGAYTAYLRRVTGLEPQTTTRDRRTVVAVRHGEATLSVTFRHLGGQTDSKPDAITLARRGTATGYRTGQLARAVAELLGPLSAATPAPAAPTAAENQP